MYEKNKIERERKRTKTKCVYCRVSFLTAEVVPRYLRENEREIERESKWLRLEKKEKSGRGGGQYIHSNLIQSRAPWDWDPL